ncbi:MAG: hypothetical protein H7Y02_10110 [Candidatus Obscuribacterales bacterium]|nr:hypothetical protein [Steroidobacteraceae bacterium]
MWIKKIFSSRTPKDDPGEEPARVAPTHTQTGAHDLKKQTEQRLKPKGGFDPYNSGTFQRDDAWKRVTRK